MRLGLDYGGTKIEGIVLDASGHERARARVPTPRFDYDGGLRAIHGLLGRLAALGRLDPCGLLGGLCGLCNLGARGRGLRSRLGGRGPAARR